MPAPPAIVDRDIADELIAKDVSLSLGGSTYDPADPVGRLLFNVLGMVAEFEYDAGEHTQAELAELFSASRTTVYRKIQRRGAATKPADRPCRWSRKGSLGAGGAVTR